MRWPFLRPSNSPSQAHASQSSTSASYSSNQAPEVDAWDRKFLLSLDGGGIRGLSSLIILEELMLKVGECERSKTPSALHSYYPDPFLQPRGSTTPNDPSYAHRYLPCHYFDIIVGTSTGGLIAIMLGRLRMSVKDAITEYRRFGEEIFGHPRKAHLRGKKRFCRFNPMKDKYSVKPLRAAIDRVVLERDPFQSGGNNNARIGHPKLETPKNLCHTMVWAVEGSSGRDGWVFRSFKWPRQEAFLQRNLNTSGYEIRQVATATTAAPTFFKPTRIGDLVFYDGGMTANNPCQHAINEIREYLDICHGKNAEDRGYLGAAVSIGTGNVDRNIPKAPRSWLGRYGEAAGWEKRRANNSSDIHREMHRFAQSTNQRLTRNEVTDAPSRFKYARFTVGKRGEPPDDQDRVIPDELLHDIARMEHMKMDEWISDGPHATLTKIEQATRAYLLLPLIQDQLRQLAEFLVINRQKRSQSDRPVDNQPRPSSSERLKWYRYASALEWECDDCGTRFYLHDDIKEHLHTNHQSELAEGVNARRSPCGLADPREIAL